MVVHFTLTLFGVLYLTLVEKPALTVNRVDDRDVRDEYEHKWDSCGDQDKDECHLEVKPTIRDVHVAFGLCW